MKAIYSLHAQGRPLREIAKTLQVSRNTVLSYVRSPELPKPKPQPRRGSKLGPYLGYIQGRLAENVFLWPSAKFTDLADLNQQARAWVHGTASVRIHGTTHEHPLDRLESERAHLRPFPGWAKVQDLLYTELTVGSDGFVRWEYGYYGVPSGHLGSKVTLNCRDGIVEIWQAGQRLAVHPRTTRRGERHHHPHQWQGISMGDPRPQQDPMAVMLPGVEVEHRPLVTYANLVAGVQA